MLEGPWAATAAACSPEACALSLYLMELID